MSIILFISGSEIFVILLAVLLLFGSKKIPDFARALGKGLQEFKKATDEIKNEITKGSETTMQDINDIRNDFHRETQKIIEEVPKIEESIKKSVNQ